MSGQGASFGRRGAVAPPPPRLAMERPPAVKAPPGFLARLPWFTIALAGALAFQFNTELWAATDFNGPLAPGHFTLLALGGSDRAQVLGHGEWWRLFTATVLHGSAGHLVGNLIALVVAGFLLEPMIGIGWFASIYFTGAFAGALLSMLLGPADMLSVGASGAIMACLAALLTVSFHAHAWRPRTLRRTAAALLFPALMPSVGSAGITDLNAHLGGMLAGVALAFLLLLAWPEDEAEPRGRSLAALLAGGWLVLTVAAFIASRHSYAGYAASGFDYIRPADMPANEQGMKDRSFALVEKYPRDPRAHLFRGLDMLGRRDLADAEPHFRDALALDAKAGLMTPGFRAWTRALLALDVRDQGRLEEAKAIAAPVCGDAALEAQAATALRQAGLCS